MTIIEMLNTARFKIEGTPKERIEAYHLVKNCMILLAADYPAKENLSEEDIKSVEKIDHISTFETESRKRIRKYLDLIPMFSSFEREVQEYAISMIEVDLQTRETNSDLMQGLEDLYSKLKPSDDTLDKVDKLFASIKLSVSNGVIVIP